MKIKLKELPYVKALRLPSTWSSLSTYEKAPVEKSQGRARVVPDGWRSMWPAHGTLGLAFSGSHAPLGHGGGGEGVH